VLADRALVELAQMRPQSPAQLPKASGLKRHHARRYGKRILRAVKSGEQASPPRYPPRPPRHSRAEVERFEALRAWRKRLAEQRGVDPDVVVSNAVLWAVAERNPVNLGDLRHIDGLGPWKRKAYGADMLRLLDEHRA
jgi:ribonuclease D